MPQHSSKTFQALSDILADVGDLSHVHPILAKRALQELYDKAEERAVRDTNGLLSRMSTLWRSMPTPEQRYIQEMADALNCTGDQAERHLRMLWDRQNAPNALEAFQRHATAQAGPVEKTSRYGAALYWRALSGLSRSECRDLLVELTVVSEQLNCDPWDVLAPDSTSKRPKPFVMFLHRLTVQAGHYYELSHDDPHRRTGVYLENLTREQAAILLQRTRLDHAPWTEAERFALHRVLRRDALLDAHYDVMPPLEAWNDICALTDQDEPYESSISDPRIISNIFYELGGLPPSEHIAALCRAAHLSLYAPPATGLAQRLGLSETSSSQEVRQKLEQLTDFEQHDISQTTTALMTSVDEALRLEGVLIDGDEHNFVPPPDGWKRIRPLSELSAHALGRIGAWQYLTDLCGLPELSATMTLAGRNELAAALVRQHPDGIDRHLELLAYEALVLPRVRAEYDARDRDDRAASEKRGPEHVL